MDGYAQFFDLLSGEEWHGSCKASEEKKLQLTLGPPGEFLSHKNTATTHGTKRGIQDSVEAKAAERNGFRDTNEKQCKKLLCHEEAAVEKLFSSPWSNDLFHSSHRKNLKDLQQSKPSYLQSSTVVELQCPDKGCPSSASASFFAATAGTIVSHKRGSLAPVVGWPPIRSFRKNLVGTGTSKQESELTNGTPKEGISVRPESLRNNLFVKINMEGVPIGRKINLNAHDSYEKLSIAIDELFRGFLSAQRETSSARNNGNKMDGTKGNADSVSGNREYTLIYEDNEGDRMLVGDVPWHMFISTAKRLTVLKSSELSNPRPSSSEQ